MLEELTIILLMIYPFAFLMLSFWWVSKSIEKDTRDRLRKESDFHLCDY